MKKFFTIAGKIVVGVGLCLGLLGSCEDNDKKDTSPNSPVTEADPSYGFMLNSTPYSLNIDLGEEEDFNINLAPGQLLGTYLKENKTYVIHVVVLNNARRAISEYVTSFYVDDIPLDNQLTDFLCNWYVEFTSTYPELGFTNKFGT